MAPSDVAFRAGPPEAVAKDALTAELHKSTAKCQSTNQVGNMDAILEGLARRTRRVQRQRGSPRRCQPLPDAARTMADLFLASCASSLRRPIGSGEGGSAWINSRAIVGGGMASAAAKAGGSADSQTSGIAWWRKPRRQPAARPRGSNLLLRALGARCLCAATLQFSSRPVYSVHACPSTLAYPGPRPGPRPGPAPLPGRVSSAQGLGLGPLGLV